MSKKIGYVTAGKDQQIISFYDFADYMDDMIYIRQISDVNLNQYGALVLPDSMWYEDVEPYTDLFNKYLENGGFLIVFDGMRAYKWIESVKLKWVDQPTKNWLWWTTPERCLEIYQPKPKHSLCKTVSIDDMSWHWSGAYAFHPQAESSLNLDNDAGSLFLDFKNLPNGGRLIVTSLDPHHHNGHRFMPATTAFLIKFYPWLNKEMGRLPCKEVKKRYTTTYLTTSNNTTTNIFTTGFKKAFKETDIELVFQNSYDISPNTFKNSDLIYIPSSYDQFFFKEKQQWFLDYLENGGQIILNSTIAIPWLPFLGKFKSVVPTPYTNLKVRIRQNIYGFFNNMDEEFNAWQGVYGQYSRGWSKMPDNAIWLTDIGSVDNPKPCDWLWQYPTDLGKGGKIFVHNGDDISMFPDHKPFKNQLIRNIVQGMLNNRHKAINPYTRYPHPPFHNLSTPHRFEGKA